MTMQGSDMRSLRRAAGMSQAELADAIGMARETIGAMERGQAPIELRTALAVRYQTEGNFVALRTPDTMHRHVKTLLDDVAKKVRPTADDQRELQSVIADWPLAGGGIVGEGLLTTASMLFRQLKCEDGDALDRAQFDLMILSLAWAVVIPHGMVETGARTGARG